MHDARQFHLAVVVLLCSSCGVAQAGLSLGPWTPLFQGVDHAVGTNVPDGTSPISNLQVVNIVRVDLEDPDVRLLTDPRAPGYIPDSRETLSLSTSNFLISQNLQIAVDANFYGPNSDPANEGDPMDIFGLQISQGVIVSAQGAGSADASSLLFTTNNRPFFVFTNTAPGTNTTGIYTAVTGRYPLVSNGQNVAPDDAHSPIGGIQPRTAFGVSADNRYLYLMTIDGRQPGYSDGAYDIDTAYWLLLVGAYNAINMDGGGSTTLVRADCGGGAVDLNNSSYIAARGRERFIGSHFGVSARPLPAFISNIDVTPSDTTATITWDTSVPANGHIDYGPTTAFGSSSTTDSRLLRKHVATMSGLSPSHTYYFQIVSVAGQASNTFQCRLQTTAGDIVRTGIFGLTQAWKFTTNNLDGVNWQDPGYNDSSWAGPGPGVLFCETPSSVPAISTVCNTPLPSTSNTNGIPGSFTMAPTYYFRTHFTFSGSPAGKTLSFSNYVDDGAVFYLNGTPIQWLRMLTPPSVIDNATLTTGGGCGANEATCADLFSISGPLVATNLHSGDNVIAVEVHQSAPSSSDIVFGCGLAIDQPVLTRPALHILREGTNTTLYWNGAGFVLQHADTLFDGWTDVPGPVTNSIYALPGTPGTKFYRLRN